MVVSREDWSYADLPGVVLRGINVYRCPKCGEYEVEIPQIQKLHEVLSAAMVAKRARLVRQEVRFLRNFLLLSHEELAQYMGTTADTIVRWESGEDPIGPVADRLLRLLVALQLPSGPPATEGLARISDEAEPLKMTMKAEASGWREAA
jgi:putative zinc finger/helix-turn-helix YgiT family protein